MAKSTSLSDPIARPKGNVKNDDVFEITFSEESIKLLSPVAILVAALLVVASVIYSSERIIDAVEKIKKSDVETTQEVTTDDDTTTTTVEYTKSDKPEISLFTMSYCPYGNLAEDFVAPVVKLLGDKVSFTPRYIVDKFLNEDEFVQVYGEEYRSQYSAYAASAAESCSDGGLGGAKYCSLHNGQELNQDVREICIWNNQNDKYWDYVLDVNNACTYENIDTCWEGIAQNHGIDTAAVKSCYTSSFVTLLDNEINVGSSMGGVGSSPTIFINGTAYPMPDSDTVWSPERFKDAVCSAFNTAPEECNTELGDGTDVNTSDTECG